MGRTAFLHCLIILIEAFTHSTCLEDWVIEGGALYDSVFADKLLKLFLCQAAFFIS